MNEYLISFFQLSVNLWSLSSLFLSFPTAKLSIFSLSAKENGEIFGRFDNIVYRSELDSDTLTSAINSLIYFWLYKWHQSNDTDDDDGIWLYPLQMAVLLAEHFTLRGCLPALLELERQDRQFTEAFFDDSDLAGMVAACIYRIATEEDLPLLASFIRERGIYTFCKSIVHCRIHTRCEAAKPLIIRLYSKYKIPNILVPGGANEMCRTIKRADIGVLAEDRDSAETILKNVSTAEVFDEYNDGEYDYDDEYGDDGEYDEYEDDGEYDEDVELSPRQEYCGWVTGGKLCHRPVRSLKKYTVRIELINSDPLVWREIEMPSSLCLTSLAHDGSRLRHPPRPLAEPRH